MVNKVSRRAVDSVNHRMVEVGRHLWKSSSLTCPAQSQPEQFVQECVHSGLNSFKDGMGQNFKTKLDKALSIPIEVQML